MPHPGILHPFPVYSRGEQIADGVVHALGVGASLLGAVWLLFDRGYGVDDGEWWALLVYAAGFCGVMISSAVYNLAPAGRIKEFLRRIDHALIYAMIAGTFTPFAAYHLQRGGGSGDTLWIVWGVAVAGMGLKLGFPRRFERFGFILYLGLGWALAVLGFPVWAALPTVPLLLLAGGGILYTLGTVAHVRETAAYHNVVWHGFVLVAAGCHFTAVALATVP